MQLPKFHETFIPILTILGDGKIIHTNDLRQKVSEKFYSNLPVELLSQQTKSGDILLLNRIGWGKAYLKEAKLVQQPERGMIQITEKGKQVLQSGHLTLRELKNDADYKALQIAKKEAKEVNAEVVDENATPEDMVDAGIHAIELQVKNELLDKLKVIDPYYFEKVVLLLLKKMGYGEFILTSKSNDGGIDGIINQDQLGLEKIFVQAKRYASNKVRETDIRNFIGAISSDTSKGIFVTTSSFDEGALKKASEDHHHKIILIDGLRFVDLMYKYGVGVQVRDTYEAKQVDEDFFEVQ
jgi:restriction system protein